MNHDSRENGEQRLREIIVTADRNASQPDREFLAGLKTRSTQRFVEAAARNSKRSRIMARIKRIAPRAMAAGVLVAIGTVVVMLTTGGRNGVAWADVRDRIEQAKAMKMKVSVTTPDKMTVQGHTVMATGGRMRQEMSVNGQKMVMIFDLGKGAMLNLLPDQKIAVTMHLKDIPKAMRDQMTRQGDHFAELKKMVRNAQEELGEKTIDGIKAKGYRVANDSMTVDIWVDAETAMPVRMESEMTDTGMKVVMSDIEIVETVDPGLFSVEVPKGYTVKPQQNVSMKPAGVKELTELFKAWAEVTDGVFPDAIDPGRFVTVARDLAKELAEKGVSSEQREALIKRVSQTVSARLVNALMLQQSNQTFHYQGKGVKFGDKATPVLWYKPEGEDKYVVMYGDLHVERVAKKDLPPKRKPAPTRPAPERTPETRDAQPPDTRAAAPKGYTVKPQQNISMRPAGVKELTELFKAWAEVTDGVFPDAINPGLFVTAAKDHAKKLAEKGVSSEQREALIKRVSQTVSARLVNALMLMQSNQTFHYQGKGVKFGDKATPVLWYRPGGEDKYVVMHGDLHVERVAKKDLPPKRHNLLPQGPRPKRPSKPETPNRRIPAPPRRQPPSNRATGAVGCGVSWGCNARVPIGSVIRTGSSGPAGPVGMTGA